MINKNIYYFLARMLGEDTMERFLHEGQYSLSEHTYEGPLTFP